MYHSWFFLPHIIIMNWKKRIYGFFKMDEDDFFDANDEIVDENEMVGDIATANLAQHLFMQNKFDESKELVNPEDKDGFSLGDLYKKIYL